VSNLLNHGNRPRSDAPLIGLCIVMVVQDPLMSPSAGFIVGPGFLFLRKN